MIDGKLETAYAEAVRRYDEDPPLPPHRRWLRRRIYEKAIQRRQRLLDQLPQYENFTRALERDTRGFTNELACYGLGDADDLDNVIPRVPPPKELPDDEAERYQVLYALQQQLIRQMHSLLAHLVDHRGSWSKMLFMNTDKQRFYDIEVIIRAILYRVPVMEPLTPSRVDCWEQDIDDGALMPSPFMIFLMTAAVISQLLPPLNTNFFSKLFSW
jgi:hypothetical protein